jgi:nitrite reductase/ring-hydroxylating ferredoxin subunit
MADVTLGALTDFVDGQLVPVEKDGHKLIVARKGDEVHVADNRCPHLGFSLTRGPGGLRYDDGVVQCPWHNSRFDVCTGANLDWAPGFAGRDAPRWSRAVIALGRKPKPLTLVPARLEAGNVVVTLTD